MNKDLFNRVKTTLLIPPQVETGDTDVVNTTAPVSVIGYESAMIEIHAGVLSDAGAIMSVKVWEGDASDGSDKAAVAAADLQIDPVLDAVPEATFQCAFDQADDSKVFKIGYLGSKKYLGLTISPVGNGGNVPVSASVVMSNPRHAPAGVTQAP